MVEIEIRTPVYNEESEQIEWEALAVLRADGDELTAVGNKAVVTPGPVVSVTTGESVHPEDNAEDWARSLPDAFRSGDLVAIVIRDDDPPLVDNGTLDDPEPQIPEPPVPALDEDRQTTLH
jgi:hypothetical protein